MLTLANCQQRIANVFTYSSETGYYTMTAIYRMYPIMPDDQRDTTLKSWLDPPPELKCNKVLTSYTP